MTGLAIKKAILWSGGIIFGIALGIFAGLIITTGIRITLSGIFDWGDSGPSWLNWILTLIAVTTMIITTKWFINSVRGYIQRTFCK